MQAEDTGVEPISDSTEESTQETTDSENPSDATERMRNMIRKQQYYR